MKRTVPLPAVLTAVLLAAACTTSQSGKPINEDFVAAIEPGSTTQVEIRRWFGEPTSTLIQPAGISVWTFEYESTEGRDTSKLSRILCFVVRLAGLPCMASPYNVRQSVHREEVLVVFFSDDKIVRDYSLYREEKPTREVYLVDR